VTIQVPGASNGYIILSGPEASAVSFHRIYGVTLAGPLSKPHHGDEPLVPYPFAIYTACSELQPSFPTATSPTAPSVSYRVKTISIGA
jgi:hypothetical protein